MQLDQYISDLLYRYECVILPEFGAFLSQYQSAQVHETTHAFYPPKKRLSFNAQLSENDGLLANYIARIEMIPHEEANQHIASYVRRLWDGLHKGKTQELANVGSLSLTDENKLVFEPSYHLNYLTASFGLSSFTSPAIAREVAQVYAEEEEKVPVVPVAQQARTASWVKYAATAAVVIGLAGLGGYSYLNNVAQHNLAAQSEAESQLESKIQEATFVIDNPLPAVTLELLQPKGKYHVVAGAFRMEENAEKRVKQLLEKGYKARQIGKNRFGLHQVVYGSYSNSQEALAALRTVRKADNKTAWLLVKELK